MVTSEIRFVTTTYTRGSRRKMVTSLCGDAAQLGYRFGALVGDVVDSVEPNSLSDAIPTGSSLVSKAAWRIPQLCGVGLAFAAKVKEKRPGVTAPSPFECATAAKPCTVVTLAKVCCIYRMPCRRLKCAVKKLFYESVHLEGCSQITNGAGQHPYLCGVARTVCITVDLGSKISKHLPT